MADVLLAGARTVGDVVAGVLPGWLAVTEPLALKWKCRCSKARVANALQMLGPAELAQMVADKEAPTASCEFCGRTYTIDSATVEKVYLETIKGSG